MQNREITTSNGVSWNVEYYIDPKSGVEIVKSIQKKESYIPAFHTNEIVIIIIVIAIACTIFCFMKLYLISLKTSQSMQSTKPDTQA